MTNTSNTTNPTPANDRDRAQQWLREMLKDIADMDEPEKVDQEAFYYLADLRRRAA